mgnify:CR=1 FL=1
MRTLTDHQVNPANDKLIVQAIDEPGSGGAHLKYIISGHPTGPTLIEFQNGPINEIGVNGLTHEALLAILIDRLQGFQSGPYASDDNQVALLSLRQAQNALQRRTRERMARGVEGTHTP